jgi:Fic family protein
MRFPALPPHVPLGPLLSREPDRVLEAPPTLPDGRYLSWDELRHRRAPEGLTLPEWWAVTRFARRRMSRPVQIMRDCYGLPFAYSDLACIQRRLHAFDRVNVGDKILSALGNPDARTEYQVRQLIEEAISSSEIEGAQPTTRELARQMLREDRPPASRDERMIANNLRAMERLQELHRRGGPLTLADFLELHHILGEDALDVEGAAGVLRGPEHHVRVSDHEGTVWHSPPDAHGIETRVEALLRFANGEPEGTSTFIHPIIRAIVAHFWLGYEHPFRDGNGRMARALYYWSMLRHGYEVAEFLSISGPIDRSPKAYYLAFAHSETDAGDLTYFVDHQLHVMEVALAELLAHLTERAARLRELTALIASFDTLNHRQRSVLEHAIRHPDEGQTYDGHARSHRVHYLTARQDLMQLEAEGLLVSRRVARTKRYYPTPALVAATSTQRTK